MKRKFADLRVLAAVLFALPLTAAAGSGLTPGLYEYTMKMNMPGVPQMSNMPATTMQRCISAKDAEGNKAFEMPAERNSDCQVKDLVQNGDRISYKMSCTKPQKLDGSVKGTITATSMALEMTMSMPEMPGPMTQSIAAKRIGDCKQSSISGESSTNSSV